MIFTIRKFEANEDKDFFDYCSLESYRGTLPNRETISKEELERKYKEFDKNDPVDLADPNHQIFIAETNEGDKAGLVWICNREPFWIFEERLCWIYNIHVLPKYRKKGLGQKLLVQTQEWSQEQNLSMIGLHVIEWNQEARKLYEKMGYKLVKTHNESHFYAKKI